MPTAPLPDDPRLEQLRKQAKELRDLAGAGVEGALDLVAEHHPKRPRAVTLSDAQLVVARHYGFASWARLKGHLELVDRYRRAPDDWVDPADDVVDEFLALACLRYGDDAPGRWQRAATLLAAHPEIPRASIHAAAAAADLGATASLLDVSPSLARTEGGPYRWEPLLYLAYARHDLAVTEAAVLDTARLLLDHGADPNAGYLWHGLTPSFTVLTGALGSGEGEQPVHPHGYALASLLLERGADANDGQALYNRQFSDDDRHLELLFAHGLGSGDGGPWRERLGHTTDSPAEMLRGQLYWAIVHDMVNRATLLVDHGADFLTPYVTHEGRPTGLRSVSGRTPAEIAAISGCPGVLSLLIERGAKPPAAKGVDGLIAAVFAGNEATVRRLKRYAAAARDERPGLVVWAAGRRNRDAIARFVELGWDINAQGRVDIPVEWAWDTALHEAAGSGDVALARFLLGLGADPTIEDGRYHATPLGWADHFEQPVITALLAPLTSGS